MFIILQGSTLYSKVFKNIRYIVSFCSKFLKQNRKSLQHAAFYPRLNQSASEKREGKVTPFANE